MKKFNYNFHGDIEVVLNDDNTLLDVTQRGEGFVLRIIGNTITLETNDGMRQFDNTLKGLYEAYFSIGRFNTQLFNLPHGDKLVVSDGESTKEIFLENRDNILSTILTKGDRVVSTSISNMGWNCYGSIGLSCESQKGDDSNIRDLTRTYVTYLEQVFGNSYKPAMH